ncbi:MAG: hypothetical protein FJ276_15055 [Planctomycetes bacterium]|nr:hypothetical protein [Planctomycetota bacterium]
MPTARRTTPRRSPRGWVFRLDDVAIEAPASSLDLLALDEAVTQLAREDPGKAELVKLRFFAGLSREEAAEVLGVSAVTVKRHWRYARVWLHRQMST